MDPAKGETTPVSPFWFLDMRHLKDPEARGSPTHRHPQALRPRQGQRRHQPDRAGRHHPGDPGRERGRQEHAHEDPVRLPAGRQRPASTSTGAGCAMRSPADAIRHGVGMLHQDPLDFPPMRVVDNLLIGAPGRIVPRRAEAIRGHRRAGRVAGALHRPEGGGRLADGRRAPAARAAPPSLAGRARADPRRADHRDQRAPESRSSSTPCAAWPPRARRCSSSPTSWKRSRSCAPGWPCCGRAGWWARRLPPFEVDRLVTMMFEREVSPGERTLCAPGKTLLRPVRPGRRAWPHPLRRPGPRGARGRDHRPGGHGGQRPEPAPAGVRRSGARHRWPCVVSTTPTSPASPTAISRGGVWPTCRPPGWRRA